MKISKIEILDYHQFKDFEIDLTYPKGHKKEGQPLDKVCFIGQSGTGKTTILNIINELVRNYDNSHPSSMSNENKYGIQIRFPIDGENTNHLYKDNNSEFHYRPKNKLQDKIIIKNSHTKHCIHLIFIPESSIDWDLSDNNQDFSDYIKPEKDLNAKTKEELLLLANKQYYDFKKDNPKEIWKAILRDVSEYNLKDLNYKNQITSELFNETAEINKLRDKVTEWKSKNPNPLEKIALALNPVLNKFNLEVETNIQLESPEDIYFIKIRNINGDNVPLHGWSSGTKQIILTSAPLIKLNTWETIILIDEPERSLYPDIQKTIIKTYSTLAPDAQFFYATHSPIIASAFEPWEIVELKFDENGKIRQEPYFKGERNVNNYFIHPQYLRWDSILYKMFDLEEEGDEERKNKLQELAEIELRLQKIKEEGNAGNETSRKLWKEFKDLAEKLDWRID